MSRSAVPHKLPVNNRIYSKVSVKVWAQSLFISEGHVSLSHQQYLGCKLDYCNCHPNVPRHPG